MNNGSIDLDHLSSMLKARRGKVWLTAVAGRDPDGTHTLMHARAIIGVRPPAWRTDSWDYETCTFRNATLTSTRLAALIRPAGPRTIDVADAGLNFDLPEWNVNWQRLPSLAPYSELPLAWPSTEYRVGLQDEQTPKPTNEYLVGEDDAPSFATFGSAFGAYFNDNFGITGTNTPSLNHINIRLVENRARIFRVRIRPASLDVWLGGRMLRGLRLELNGADYRTTTVVERGGRVTLPLPGGLPSDAWLWLKSGHHWLDYRALTGWGARVSPDVETELPRDSTADLSRLMTQGEGPQLEYKQQLPETRTQKRTVFKTVVAFANGTGGRLLFGVGDAGELIGVPGKPTELRTRINDLVRDLVSPSPTFRIHVNSVKGRTVAVLEVLPSNGILHALVVEGNRPEFYVRRDGTTFFARPEEIVAVVRDGATHA